MLIKNKKSLFLSLLSLSICIMFSACSKGETVNKKESQASADSPEISVQAPDNKDKKSGEKRESSDSTLQMSIGDGNEGSAKLPDNYPSDVFPLYRDSFIVSAVEMDGSFTITAFSKAYYTELAAFYKEFLKDAEIMAEMNLEKSFTSFGKISGYTYNFDTGASDEMDGYASSLAILLMPLQ
ncbi:MAG: hypothetical protein RBQ97_12385 [Acholeplasma sp.]|nr:hypothetical protein [Acholeplasma sp.]